MANQRVSYRLNGQVAVSTSWNCFKTAARVRPGRSFGQFGHGQGEHRLDESDLGFRDNHDSSVAARKGVEKTIAIIGIAKRKPVSTQPKSSPSGVIDIDFAMQFRALRSDHPLLRSVGSRK
jgi:hypothetical protein